MRICDFGQFWGADFKNRCYTGQYRGLQPRFDAYSLVLGHIQGRRQLSQLAREPSDFGQFRCADFKIDVTRANIYTEAFSLSLVHAASFWCKQSEIISQLRQAKSLVIMVNLGALISKIDVTRANNKAVSLVLVHAASFWCKQMEIISQLRQAKSLVILVNFGALISKIDVTQQNTEAFSLVLVRTASFWCLYMCLRQPRKLVILLNFGAVISKVQLSYMRRYMGAKLYAQIYWDLQPSFDTHILDLVELLGRSYLNKQESQ